MKNCVKFLVLFVGYVLLLFSDIESVLAETLAKDRLTVALINEFDGYHPLTNDGKGSFVHYLLHRPLILADESWNWRCELCEEIPSVESKTVEVIKDRQLQKMLTTWRLKKNLKWSDGKDITSKDVIFSWKMWQNFYANGRYYNPIEYISDIVANPKDPLEFKITFLDLNSDFYKIPNFFLMPSHLEASQIVEDDSQTQGERSKLSNYKSKLTLAGLYSGPYVVDKKLDSNKLILTKNKYFYGQKPTISNIEILFKQSSVSLANMISSSRIDVIPETEVSYNDMYKLTQNSKNFKVVSKINNQYESLVLNLQNNVLLDQSVREALASGIDKKSIVQNLSLGNDNIATSFVCKSDPNYYPNVIRYEYDFHRSSKLLEDAGWIKEKDGYRYKNKQRLTVDIVLSRANPLRVNIVEQIKSHWAKLGVTTNVVLMSSRKQFNDMIEQARFEDSVMLKWSIVPDILPISFLSSREAPVFENNYVGQNIGSFRSKEVDALIDEYRATLDPVKKRLIYASIVYEYSKRLPAIPLLFWSSSAAVTDKLKNFSVTGHEVPASYKAEYWEF